MDVEAKAAIFNELNEGNTTAFKALEDSVEDNSKEVTSALKELKDVRDSQLKSLNEALVSQGLAIKKLTDDEKAASSSAVKSIKTLLTENKEALEGIKHGTSNERISFKAVGTMLISGNVSGGNVPVEQRLAGFDELASRDIRLLDLVSRATASSNVISWVSQANQEGTAGGTAEGALKNQLDFDLVVDSQSVKKRTAFIKISEEMLGDIDFMNAEINRELIQELTKDIENQVYQGNNAGTNLNGIRTTATAFTPGTFATGQPNEVDNANVVDVLRVAVNQIAIAEQGTPTAILMNPEDLTALLMQKVTSTDKRYIMALQEIASNRSLDGIPIIVTTLVTADDYLVGNFPMSTVYDRGAVSIEMGRDADDFTKNLVTIIAEWRGLVITKTNKRTAFVKGDFTTDIAAILKP
jgi:HK97 family phage major capsid protein